MSAYYAFMIAACARCKQPMTFNPHKVPALRINGVKEPVCRGCHDILNAEREKLGLERWPEPQEGAYEPLPEEEL